jgi:hypothetical protein
LTRSEKAAYSFCEKECQWAILDSETRPKARLARSATYSDDLETDQAGDVQDIASGNTEEECNRVADVSDDQLDSKVVFPGQAQVASPPRQQARDKVQQCDDDKECGDDHAGDFDSQPGTVGQSLQDVLALVGIVFRHNDLAGGQGLFLLGVAQVAQSERGRNGHDAARNQHLRVEAKVDVGDENRAGDRCEPARHDLVDLSLGQVLNERLDQHGTLALSDERRSRCNDSLGAGDLHAPEEEDGEFADEPLDDSPVVEHLDEGDKEDDGGDDASQEPGKRSHTRVSQELDTFAGETEELAGEKRDESEDVVANFCAKHEEGDDELDKLVKSVSIEFIRLLALRSLTIPMIIVCPLISCQHRSINSRVACCAYS